MNRKMVIVVVSGLFAIGVFSLIHPAAFAGCKEDCYKDCCGDESICTSEDERACVSDCIKEFCDSGSASAQTAARTDADRSGEDIADSGKNGGSGNDGTPVSD